MQIWLKIMQSDRKRKESSPVYVEDALMQLWNTIMKPNNIHFSNLVCVKSVSYNYTLLSSNSKNILYVASGNVECISEINNKIQ